MQMTKLCDMQHAINSQVWLDKISFSISSCLSTRQLLPRSHSVILPSNYPICICNNHRESHRGQARVAALVSELVCYWSRPNAPSQTHRSSVFQDLNP